MIGAFLPRLQVLLQQTQQQAMQKALQQAQQQAAQNPQGQPPGMPAPQSPHPAMSQAPQGYGAMPPGAM